MNASTLMNLNVNCPALDTLLSRWYRNYAQDARVYLEEKHERNSILLATVFLSIIALVFFTESKFISAIVALIISITMLIIFVFYTSFMCEEMDYTERLCRALTVIEGATVKRFSRSRANLTVHEVVRVQRYLTSMHTLHPVSVATMTADPKVISFQVLVDDLKKLIPELAV